MRTALTGSRWWKLAAVGAAGTVLLAACGSSHKSAASTSPSPSSGTSGSVSPTTDATNAIQGGTATFAEPPDTTPNYIFPITPGSSFSVSSISDLQELMFRPLYWFGDGESPVLDPSLSPADVPVYTDGGKTATITMKGWKFSDGTTVDAASVVLGMELLKAALKESPSNYGAYVPGLFPDNVVSFAATGPDTVVFHLNKGYSSEWFTYNELSQLFPMPAAWDKESASGTPGNYASTPAGATKVYNFLAGQAKDLGTYATNPLWQDVDGPWKLKTFASDGEAVFSYNTAYSGPVPPMHISTFTELPYTSDSAEFNVLKSGSTGLDYGYLPAQDISQKSSLTSSGYIFDPWEDWGFNYAPYNFQNPTLGPVFNQLYFRQAMQEIEDQPGYIKAFDAGYGVPTYGPVPLQPTNPFASPLEESDLYPYNIATATSLLTSHGWKDEGGTDVCTSSACGTGVKVGTKLDISFAYASGSTEFAAQMAQLKSDASKAGITLSLLSEPFNNVIGTAQPCTPKQAACKWQINDWGGGWTYSPDYLPTGEELFATGASANYGSYDDPTNNAYITATELNSAPSVLTTYENYLVRNLPVFYQPNPPYALSEISNKLGGALQQESTLGLTPEQWYLCSSACSTNTSS